MRGLDYLMAGRFEEAIEAYKIKSVDHAEDEASASGLAHAYMGAGRYEEAVPWEWRVHERAKLENPDSPGEHLYLACAYWCLGQRPYAVELARGLCAGIVDRSISMAPDQAGGATFGLILHYMAITAGDDVNRDYALEYLRRLNVKYDKRPTLFYYPVHTVKQLLSEVSFEDALKGATNEGTLSAAYRVAEGDRSAKLALGVVLFHDGVLSRVQGHEIACMERMRQVYELGYQTESIRWYLARHEVRS